MIDIASISLVNELNTFIQNKLGQKEEKVVLSSILDQNGKIVIEENKIVSTLIDINQESALINNQHYVINPRGGYTKTAPTIHLNLFFLFSAYFSVTNYQEALKYLSYVVTFFQAKPVFTPQNTPTLKDSGVEKLVMQLYHLDSNTKNNMWNSLGLKYMPSVIYKVGMVNFIDDHSIEQVDSISGLETEHS